MLHLHVTIRCKKRNVWGIFVFGLQLFATEKIGIVISFQNKQNAVEQIANGSLRTVITPRNITCLSRRLRILLR